MSQKIKLLNRKYSTNTAMLIVDSFIEIKDNGFVQELIMFEINHYRASKKIVILLDVFTLRGLSIAIINLINDKDSKFKKFSQSKNSKKTLSIGKSSNKIFINLEKNDSSNNEHIKIEYIFGTLGAESFAMELEEICSFTNNELFSTQKDMYAKGALR